MLEDMLKFLSSLLFYFSHILTNTKFKHKTLTLYQSWSSVFNLQLMLLTLIGLLTFVAPPHLLVGHNKLTTSVRCRKQVWVWSQKSTTSEEEFQEIYPRLAIA